MSTDTTTSKSVTSPTPSLRSSHSPTPSSSSFRNMKFINKLFSSKKDLHEEARIQEAKKVRRSASAPHSQIPPTRSRSSSTVYEMLDLKGKTHFDEPSTSRPYDDHYDALRTLAISSEMPRDWAETEPERTKLSSSSSHNISKKSHKLAKHRPPNETLEGSELNELIEIRSFRLKFLFFLEKHYCAENLYCYEAILTWKKLERFMEPRLVKLKAEEVFRKYIKANAECQVNVPTSLRKKVEDALQSPKVPRNIFDSVMVEMHKLLYFDSFVKFKQSPHYTDYLLKSTMAIHFL